MCSGPPAGASTRSEPLESGWEKAKTVPRMVSKSMGLIDVGRCGGLELNIGYRVPRSRYDMYAVPNCTKEVQDDDALYDMRDSTKTPLGLRVIYLN